MGRRSNSDVASLGILLLFPLLVAVFIHKKRPEFNIPYIGLLITIAVLHFFYHMSFPSMITTLVIVGGFLTTIALVIIAKKEYSKHQRYLACIKYIDDIVERNFSTLVGIKNRMIYYDEFGDIVDKRWKKEVKNYLSTKIFPDSIVTNADVAEFLRAFDDLIENKLSTHEDFLSITSGFEYERYVRQLYEVKGYHVINTPPTGDQGVDLIAEKEDE